MVQEVVQEEGGGQPDGNMRAQVFYAGDDDKYRWVNECALSGEFDSTDSSGRQTP